MSKLEEIRERFRKAYGFDVVPYIAEAFEEAFRTGNFDIVGGTAEEREILRMLLTDVIEPKE